MQVDVEKLEQLVEFLTVNKKMTEDEAKQDIFKKGPQQLARMGLSLTGGWRAGYTKQTIAQRKADRRKKEKNRRRVVAQQRKQK